MKRTGLVILALLSICFLLGCDKDKDEKTYLILSQTELTFENGGGSMSFMIESNTDWVVSSSEDWINVVPTHGNGNQEVMVNVANQWNPIVQEGTLSVRTGDGSQFANIKIKLQGAIPGYPNSEDKVLALSNNSNIMALGGQKYFKDSLIITSNIAWDIKGPDWIEAWDGERWRPLSQEKAVVYGMGNTTVRIRTASSNDEIHNREATLVIAERMTGQLSNMIEIHQLGKYIVSPGRVIRLSTGLGMDWICGTNVSSFYYNVSEKMESAVTIDPNDVINNWNESNPTYNNGEAGLKENTMYYITTISKESLNTDYYQYYTFVVKTKSSQNQPFANIEDVFWYDDIMYLNMNMNNYAFAYFVFGDCGGVWKKYNTPLLAKILYDNMLTGNTNNFVPFTTSGYVPLSAPEGEFSDVHIVSWAIGNDGLLSGLLERKTYTFGGSSKARETKNIQSTINGVSKEELQTMKYLLRRR